MTIWWSSCRAVRGMRARDAFAGKHVIHFSNSVTILAASSGGARACTGGFACMMTITLLR